MPYSAEEQYRLTIRTVEKQSRTSMNPRISIILPIYNAEILLKDCFDSIKHQTYQDYEVVVVDDGSTDRTPILLHQFAREDRRIRICSFDKNRGIVAALNHGLEQSRGSWIARMDADDIMHPERLERQLTFMEKHPEVDLLGCRVSIFRRDGALTTGQVRYRNWSNSLLSDERIKQEIFAESPIMHPTFFLRREFYRKLNGYSDYPWPEDYDLLLKASLQKATFAKLPEVLLHKRDHPARIVRTDDRCKRKAMVRAKAFYFQKLSFLREKRVMIVGTGPSGKQLAAALRKEGIRIDGFVHNCGTKKIRKWMGAPIFSLTHQNAKEFFSESRSIFFLLAVGDPTGKAALEKVLFGSGLLPGKHYYKCI